MPAPEPAYATLTVPSAVLGAFSVVAGYPGDANDLASSSLPSSYTVIPTPTVATLTLSQTQVPLQSNVHSHCHRGRGSFCSNGQRGLRERRRDHRKRRAE